MLGTGNKMLNVRNKSLDSFVAIHPSQTKFCRIQNLHLKEKSEL